MVESLLWLTFRTREAQAAVKVRRDQDRLRREAAELGIPVREIAPKYGVTDKTVYPWRRKYDGLSPSKLKRLKDLERENGQLKKSVAEFSLNKEILQDVLRERL